LDGEIDKIPKTRTPPGTASAFSRMDRKGLRHIYMHPQVRALCLVGCVVFLAVSAKFLLPECQFPYMLYEIGYIYCLSVFRPA
jgi:hypothetical protein